MADERGTFQSGKPMSTPEAILVAMDFSVSAERALDTALAWRRPGAEITLLTVVDVGLVEQIRGSQIALAEGDPAAQMADDALRRLAQLIAERDLENVQPMVVHGHPFVEIVKVANDLDLDLIIIGQRGHANVEQILFGGTAEKVLRAANRPVLCIP
jgi:nucleotide-binding universal stress UspA family protein